MKELEKKAVKELSDFYKCYITETDQVTIKLKARQLYNEYIPGSTILSETINSAVGPLIDIYGNTGINPPTKKEAKEILEKLKKLQKELE